MWKGSSFIIDDAGSIGYPHGEKTTTRPSFLAMIEKSIPSDCRSKCEK